MAVVLLEHEGREVLNHYGIKNVPGEFCPSKAEMIAAAKRIGYPVVLKVVSHQVIHKSEVGGVKVNIPDQTSLENAYTEMLLSVREHVPDAHIEGVLVTKFINGAKEVIVGALHDSQFGAVIMTGLGGIFVEVFKDVSFAVAPIDMKEAQHMIKSLKSYPILTGVRGDAPVNLEALQSLLVKVSEYVSKENVLELDLNPVFCIGDEVLIGDVRILLKEDA